MPPPWAACRSARIPIACAAIGAPGADGLVAFFVRKDRKQHGLQRWIEGPLLEPGTRCLVVEDVVTTGGSTIQAIERIARRGWRWPASSRSSTASPAAPRRSSGGRRQPYRALVTIDELYPERPDRAERGGAARGRVASRARC